jgi:hypothetical protein
MPAFPCPPGFSNVQGKCWGTCPPTTIDVGGTCRDKCKAGFNDVNGVCYGACPQGAVDAGPTGCTLIDLTNKTESEILTMVIANGNKYPGGNNYPEMNTRLLEAVSINKTRLMNDRFKANMLEVQAWKAAEAENNAARIAAAPPVEVEERRTYPTPEFIRKGHHVSGGYYYKEKYQPKTTYKPKGPVMDYATLNPTCPKALPNKIGNECFGQCPPNTIDAGTTCIWQCDSGDKYLDRACIKPCRSGSIDKGDTCEVPSTPQAPTAVNLPPTDVVGASSGSKGSPAQQAIAAAAPVLVAPQPAAAAATGIPAALPAAQKAKIAAGAPIYETVVYAKNPQLPFINFAQIPFLPGFDRNKGIMCSQTPGFPTSGIKGSVFCIEPCMNGYELRNTEPREIPGTLGPDRVLCFKKGITTEAAFRAQAEGDATRQAAVQAAADADAIAKIEAEGARIAAAPLTKVEPQGTMTTRRTEEGVYVKAYYARKETYKPTLSLKVWHDRTPMIIHGINAKRPGCPSSLPTMIDGMCYGKCPPNTIDTGKTCREPCKEGEKDLGAVCMTWACPPNSIDKGEVCLMPLPGGFSGIGSGSKGSPALQAVASVAPIGSPVVKPPAAVAPPPAPVAPPPQAAPTATTILTSILTSSTPKPSYVPKTTAKKGTKLTETPKPAPVAYTTTPRERISTIQNWSLFGRGARPKPCSKDEDTSQTVRGGQFSLVCTKKCASPTDTSCYKPCPPGTDDKVSFCESRCPAGYRSDGKGKCWADCPAGTVDQGTTCRQQTCPGGTKDVGGVCYEACPQGSIDIGDKCREQCAPGSKDINGTCWGFCPPGTVDEGTTCNPNTKKPNAPFDPPAQAYNQAFYRAPSGYIGWVTPDGIMHPVSSCQAGTCPGQRENACANYRQLTDAQFSQYKQGTPFTCSMMTSNFSDYGEESVEGMEPQWTKQISNRTVCNWFYIFFLLNTFVVVVLLFSLFKSAKGNIRARLIQVFPAAVIGTVNVLFWYLMCDRTLLNE